MRLEHAEERRLQAEETRAAAERDRIVAEQARQQYEALADENSRLYDQAQKAVRAREQILEMVSHDLKNPLGTILLTASLLPDIRESDERQPVVPQAVGRIRRSAQSMLRLIEDLLDFASIEAGRLAIKCEPQDAGALVREALASIENLARDKQLRFTAEIEPQLRAVCCDRERIHQVLTNLIGNAAKVTPDGGEISVFVAARGQHVLFTVSDTGPGISHEDAKHLFERYWRSDETAYKGTGLGLAIASAIVGAHGGEIWVESELGRGATLLFTLPAPL